MKKEFPLPLAALLAMALLQPACFVTEPDVYKCSKNKLGCPEGYTCSPRTWECVPKGSQLDGPTPEAALDGPPVDGPGPDGPPGPLPDSAGPDAARDAALPDQQLAPDSGPTCIHPQVVKNCAKDGQGVEWCTIPKGCFQMGSPGSEKCRLSNETQHPVTLTHNFQIQRTEVTQAQFTALMGYSPSQFQSCGGTCPVEYLNWYESAAYANALSAKAGKTACYTCTGSGATVQCKESSSYAGAAIYTCPGFRLPTEAESEYAYRAGTSTAYYSGVSDSKYCSDCKNKEANLDKIAWYCANSGKATHPVAQKAANAWGLYDMAGNVWEWCHDGYQANLGSAAVTDPVGSGASVRAVRGGSWYYGPLYTRAAYRGSYTQHLRLSRSGLRVVRTLP